MNTPNLKWESPPTQSEDHFGNPDQQYTSLFGMGMDAGTPQSYDDDSMFGESMMSDNTPVPEGDSGKKPVKKRKSWGQQLPEPKTNLPPRKRAKTEDEKEQRRVERVLRNRRAAQSSRERKRQEVEALEAEKRAIEDRNCLLEEELATSPQQQVAVMRQQLAAATGGNMTTFHGASAPTTAHTEQFRSTPSPVTLSQELFSSLGAPAELSTLSTMPIHTPAAESETVNPASLSPQTQPVLDESSHANLGFFADGFLAPADAFEPNNFDMDAHNNFDFNNDIFQDYIHHDENNQPSPQAQSADQFVEQDAFLQPPTGASIDGCDVGGNAVRV
ncbi:hypothetical protein BJ878DRAFT_420972 [Calycina marina]|uniref:BZIP domain-containing protein n=1 Tax=Calycina marina TaxID=1763456 RepID=A0A9P7Z3E6_9HELO|nr:hypothetical protein BJ878DRAFT_420972 [Calycina marina]